MHATYDAAANGSAAGNVPFDAPSLQPWLTVVYQISSREGLLRPGELMRPSATMDLRAAGQCVIGYRSALKKRGNMKEDVQQLIQDARRAVRIASGIPLTQDEQAEESRLKEIQEMNMFIWKSLTFKVMWALQSVVIWTPNGAVVEFTMDKQVFHLRKDKGGYALFAIKDQTERELLRLDGNDPIFANRILVAIGDYTAKRPDR